MSDVTDHICTVRDETGNWSVLLIESSFWLNVWQTLWRDLCVMTICGNIMLIIFLVRLLHSGKVLQSPSLDSMWQWEESFLRWNDPKWMIFVSEMECSNGGDLCFEMELSQFVMSWDGRCRWCEEHGRHSGECSSLMERTLVKMLHILPGYRSVDLETWPLM